jgi:ribosomal subunit interface protein
MHIVPVFSQKDGYVTITYMKINILGNKLDLTPSIKKYIQDKFISLEKMLSRFEKEGEVMLFVEIARSTKHHRKGDVFYAEATLELPQKKLRVEHFDADVRASIDVIKDTLRNELKKYKEIQEQKKYGKKRE